MTTVDLKSASPSGEAGVGAAKPDASKSSGRRPVRIAIALAAAVLLAGAAYYVLNPGYIQSTDDAQTDGNAVAIAPRVAGYVVELPIHDNQRVKAGEILLKIEPRDYLAARDQGQAALSLAEALQENARVNVEITQVSAPAKLNQAKAQLDAAAANRDYAAATLRRVTSLSDLATTPQARDQAVAQAKSTEATVSDNEAQLQIAGLVPQAIAQAKAQLDQAIAQVSQARAQLDAAEINLGYTVIRAPQDGWITLRNVQLGSYVQPGQSLFSLVTTAPWITANFKENQLGRMRPGQRAVIRIDAYRKLELIGHVDSIQMGTGSRFSAFPAENATGNYVKIVQRVPVKIVIDSGLDGEGGLPLGLSVEPRVDTR
jgi:membrane fusion protein (multidrug efflux system)